MVNHVSKCITSSQYANTSYTDISFFHFFFGGALWRLDPFVEIARAQFVLDAAVEKAWRLTLSFETLEFQPDLKNANATKDRSDACSEIYSSQ